VLGEAAPVAAADVDLRRDACLSLGCTSADRVGSDRDAPVSASVTSTGAGPAGGLAEKTADATRAIEERRFDDAARLVDEITRTNPGSAAGPELLSKLARAYRRAKLFRPAADAYRRLIAEFPGTNAAVNGLVALAQIEQDALGDPTAALLHFEQYLSSRPSGFLAEAARAGRVRALSRLGRSQSVIGATGEYLASHPGGVSSAEMYRRRGDALARLGRCAEAKRDFSKVIDGWHGTAEAERAAAGLAACGE
jgi:TolA-binding protein